MHISTPINETLRARLERTGFKLVDQLCDIIERPVSYAASLGWPVCTATASHWAATEYLSHTHPLTPVATGLVICSEAAQWYAHRRQHELADTHQAHQQATTARQISWFLGVVLTGLYSLAIWQAARAAGFDLAGWSLAGVVALAAGIAWAGYVIKFALCDPPTVRDRPSAAPDLAVLDLEAILRARGEPTPDQIDPRLAASATRPAAERFALWKKRERMARTRARTAAA